MKVFLLVKRNNDDVAETQYEIFSTEEKAKKRLLELYTEEKKCKENEDLTYFDLNSDGKLAVVEKDIEYTNKSGEVIGVESSCICFFIEEKELQ